MNHYRYIELAAAGPTITKKDRERLKIFVPRLTVIARSIRIALQFAPRL